MSFNLREELKRLASTAPILKEKDEAYSDDETRAKVESKSADYERELEILNDDESDRRRIRASIGDLSEYGKRYKGKSVSRKKFQQMDSDEDEDEYRNSAEEFDEEEQSESDRQDSQAEEEEEEEENGDLEEQEPSAKKRNKGSGLIDDRQNRELKLNVVNFNRNEEVEKGKAVKHQLNFWDLLLESRIKLQNALNTVNQFPQYDYFDKLIQNLSDDFEKNSQSLSEENETCIVKAINQLLELQQRLVLTNPETSYMLNELNINSNSDNENKNDLKRKRNGEGENDLSVDSDELESEDDEEESEQDDDEEEEESDQEEIYSDTDEEMRAQEIKKAKKFKKLKKFDYKPLVSDQIEDYLAKFSKSFSKYKEATIQKWYDKTRLITGKSFQALEKPILQQIEHILLDKDRIIKRTQLKRSLFKICGKQEAKSDDSLETLRDRHLKDYDEEIFDDQDFYNQLLRELIDRKTNAISDPIELSRRAIELQKLRSQSKKKVDTKASKGRKIRFDVHKPMVNFMAPIYRVCMPEEARIELFKSLFGNHITMPTTNGTNLATEELDFSNIFKGF